MITIEDIPPEIVEKFAPYMEPKTISNLRLVNKRFNAIFSADRFNRLYLNCPEREYLTELKSECRGDGVKDVVEKIRRCKVRHWRGLLELEKVHRENWRLGKLEEFDELVFPQDVAVSKMKFEDLYDYNLEHWLLCTEPYSRSIFLFNITAKPRMVFKLQLEIDYRDAWLLPGQVAIADTHSKLGLFNIFDIVRTNDEFKLQFKCHIDVIAESSVPTPGANAHQQYRKFLMESAIVYDDELTVLVTAVKAGISSELHIWNLKNGTKMDKVDFGEHEVWEDFLRLSQRLYPSYVVDISVRKGEFPFVVVTLCGRYSVQITIFNVMTSEVRLVHKVVEKDDFPDTYTRDCSPKLKNGQINMVGGHVLFQSNSIVALCQVGPRYERGRLLFQAEGLFPRAVLGKKYLLTYNDEIKDRKIWLAFRVYAIEDSSVTERASFSIPTFSCNFLAFGEPNLLVFLNRSNDWKVFNFNGEKVFSQQLNEPLTKTSFHTLPQISRTVVFVVNRTARLYYF